MKKKIKISNIIIPILLIAVAACCVVPFLTIIFTSLESQESVIEYGYSFFPRDPTLDSYRYVLSNSKQLFDSYALTIFVTVVGTVISMVCMTLCAYALSRNDFKLKGIISFFIYFTMLFSGGIVSSYIWIARYLRLSNTVWALIFPSMMSAYNIFILRVACKSIPYSLVECAKLEGANELYRFIRIIIPLAKTGIATIALLVMFQYWNDWYLSMMYMDMSERSSLQYYLVKILNNVNFAKQHASASGGLAQSIDVPDQGVRMAICALAAGPMLLAFPFFQKYFVKGITVGSVKG